MQLIPSLIIQHLQKPEKIEELFVAYILAAELTISASKTIAGVAYFDKKGVVIGDVSLSFFKENFSNILTNIPGGSFIRPESEHFLIWAVRFETALGINVPEQQLYTPGMDKTAWYVNLEMTITTNSDVKLKQFPVSEALTDLTNRDNGVIPFAEPIFWAGQTDFELVLKNTGDVAAIAGDVGAIKPTLLGMGLI